MTHRQELNLDTELSQETVDLFRMATHALRDQAGNHARLGRFSLIDRESDYFQDFREVYSEPVPEPSLNKIENMCRAFMGRPEQPPEAPFYFDRLRAAFAKKPTVLEDSRKLMQDGGRLLLITNHRELVDVAMAMAAFQCEIGNPELIKTTRIFVGPITKELQIMGYPTIAALQESAGVLVGFPATESTRQRVKNNEIDSRVISQANLAMLNEFRSQIAQGDIKLAVIAPSGSTDEDKRGSIIMKKASQATAAIARRYFDAVLPVAIVLDEEKTDFGVGDLRSLHVGRDLHDIMEQDLAPIYKKVSGKKVVYERPGRTLGTRSAQELGGAAIGGSRSRTDREY